MTNRTLAILSVSAGAGHRRAAQALEAEAARRGGVTAVHIDVAELASAFFRHSYTDGYVRLVDRHPQIWGAFYRATDHAWRDSTLNRFIRGIERFAARKLKPWLRRHAPDAVICTHFMPAQILSGMLGRGTWTRPTWVAVTDFDCHGLWLLPHLSGYCAASDEVAWRMRARGLERTHLEVTGIPIMPEFAVRADRSECARELGLDPARTTLLMMAGGAGLSGLEAMVERVLALPHDVQVVAVAGRNKDLEGRLRALAAKHPGRLFPLGFTTTIHRVMAASDLAITKSGGLTTSECLALGLPMIVVSPIPGQEERNADHLLENGAALKAYDPATLAYRVDLLLKDRARLAGMAQRAAALGRPDAARRILDCVLGDLDRPAR